MASSPPPEPAPPPAEPAPPPEHRDYRHLRTTITLVVLTVLVVGAGFFAWILVTSSSNDDEEPNELITAPTCAVAAPTDAPPPEEIGLNVYNATDRNGLAQNIAGEMRERGFAILDVANDPTTRTVVHVAEIRATDEEQPGVDLLLSHFPGAVFYPDERTDPSIDLVLGDAFDGIPPEPEAGEPAEPDSTATPLPAC